MRALLVVCLLATAAHANTTVFLERGGRGDIPRFGGGDRAWAAIVGCVQRQYAPFAVDITDARPARKPFITAVVGGMASQMGLDDDTTNGVGPYDGSVERNAVVNVFSQVGTGERDIENLCAVTAHEVGHALGLDHEVLCGDIMSYYLDQCGARTFMDQDAPCGENEERACGSGDESQNSYQRLVALVGLRTAPVQVDDDGASQRGGVTQPDVEPAAEDPAPDADPQPWPHHESGSRPQPADDGARPRQHRRHGHHRRRHAAPSQSRDW